MVAVNQIAVQETRFVYTTQGVDQTRAQADRLAGSLDRLAGSQSKAIEAEGKGAAAADKLAQAKAQMASTLERAERQNQAAMMQAAAAAQVYDQSLGGVADAQMRAAQSAAQAAAQQQRAANDNARALGLEGEAFKAAGKFALEHPILVLAGSVAAARALSGLATSAAGSLGAASASTAAFAEGATGMGAAVVGGATVAARGLGLASTAATAAAGGLGAYAEKVAGLTTATSLLTRGLSLVPPALLPIAAAFVVFEAGSAVFGKAYNDLDRLVQLGQRAEKLDVGAPFLKSFEALGSKVRATADEMDAALSRASNVLRDQWGQGNALSKMLGEISATGVAGANGLQSTALADTATTTEERIRAALEAMKELDALGLHLASLQVGEKVFGPEFVERLRTGQTTIAQISSDLDAAAQKDLVRQDQVDRALALSRQIADTKQAISDAWAVTVDWSGAALLLNEAWLKILQAVQWVVELINSGIEAATNFGSAVATSIGGAFDAVSNKATALLSQLGIIAKQQAAPEVQGPPEQYGPFQPKITGRSFPYVFGPTAPSFQQANTGAKQAQQAAQQAASSYELLIKRTEDRIAELDLETQTIGKNTDAVVKLKLENELARAAQKSGVEVTAAMREEWDKLGDKLAASTSRLQDSRRAFELMKEGQRELADNFTTFVDDIVLGGQKMEQAFASLAKTLGSNALKAVISGEGPLAGLLGTASTERGQIGGLLGGKINLGGLFDTDKISDALGMGAETGIGKALKSALTPSKAGGGILSSPLGGGLAAAGAGAAIGYSSQSPLIGAAGGALTGLATGNPVMALVGAGAGLLGGLFGESQAKKEAKKKLQQEIQARKEALEQARPQIEQLAITFEGGSIGNVGKQIADAQAQLRQAAKTASEGGDQALADRLMRDYQTYVARMTATFADAFNGVLAEVQAGFGTNGPFSQAVASVQGLGEALKGFVADAGRLSDPNAVQLARTAAVEGALSSLDAPKTLSSTQAEMQRIAGTAAGLNQVLKDLGLSAEQTASVIAERTTRAIDALRDKFTTDLTRKINDARGQSYLNDAADLVKEVGGMRIDAGAVGADLGQVEAYFQAAAQKIVDSSQLTGAAFQSLVAQFPELNGLLHEFGTAVTGTAEAIDAANQRAGGYQDRLFAAQHRSDSLADQLAIFDRQSDRDRAAEVKAGGQALVDLEAAQAAERANIIADFGQKAADALASRLKGYQDRLFAASVDTSTLGGALAAFDHQAGQERLDEVKAGGEGLLLLEQTLAAERARIVQQFWRQAQEAFDQFASNLKKFLDGLTAGANSPLSPEDRLAAAQAQYDQQLAAARAGNTDALGGITGYAQALLDASKAFYASSETFQDTFAEVVGQLTVLPGQVGVGAFMKYATGGWVNGPGTSTSDSVVARLSAGEFVMSAAAASRYGPLLEAMNDDRPVTVAAPVRPAIASGGDGDLIAEVRALRDEVAALRGDVREGNDIAEAGHLGTASATRAVGAGIDKGNRVASRREVAA
ncbi:hypothetical protein Q8W71_17700 [Methylobacterium sp. NEAU 140]|uniref:hypothetical protein n=1 Tax=Methylobacterium sp. NEAU 140 TaxID=3064945 RepID=UPI002734F513|nr:hypothetical protein [Methylobacterium sp. NEAU 140]MDP4024463.1 hypothetical protein [Methylobacterium sp. NEAU 140]